MDVNLARTVDAAVNANQLVSERIHGTAIPLSRILPLRAQKEFVVKAYMLWLVLHLESNWNSEKKIWQT